MTCSCGNPRCMMAGSSPYHVAQYEPGWGTFIFIGAVIAIMILVAVIGG